MSRMLEGKVAIVTGAGRGLGRQEALGLAREGAKVVVNDMGGSFDGSGTASAPADEVVKEIKEAGGEAVANYESVIDFAGAKRIVDSAISNFGKLNILVNNAGILRDRMLFKMSEEEWDSVVAVHLKGTFNCARHACEYWRDQHKAGNTLNGRLINTVSDAGLLGNVAQSNYGAAKAAIASFSLIASREMAGYGVTSNCVAPAARTRLTTEATPSLAAVMGNVPEPGQWDMFAPEHIAPIVIYLASDDSQQINGEVFRVMGDMVWFLRGWHNVEMVSNGQKAWTAVALGSKLKEMVAKAPEKKDLAGIMMEAFGA